MRKDITMETKSDKYQVTKEENHFFNFDSMHPIYYDKSDNELKAYQQRFVFEYLELKQRLSSLAPAIDYICDCEIKNVICTLSAQQALLKEQYIAMSTYLNVLKKRAEIEKIDLSLYEKSTI